MKNDRRGILIILSSPSGAGKSSLAKELMEWDEDIVFSVSSTTRDSRPGEKNGREYNFATVDEFKVLVDSDMMLEHAEVFGHMYGSPVQPVEKALKMVAMFYLILIGKEASRSAIQACRTT